jgi:hypothetical protein
MKLARLLACAILLFAEPALADSATSKQRALAHFEAGVSRSREKDYAAALQEFEAAYRLAPHHSVLYNIGQTRLALGQVVEAVAAFDQYLSSGAELPAARRAEVEALLDTHRRHFGRLRIELTEPLTTRVWLDGVELDPARLATPIVVAAGQRSVLFASADGSPQARAVRVAAGSLEHVILPAPLPARSPPPAAPELSQLAIACETPDVAVLVAGVERAKTPVRQPLLVPAGSLRVHFRREGYRLQTLDVTTEPGQVAYAACHLRIDPALPKAAKGRLIVRSEPRDAIATVDGQRFAEGTLPSGKHLLRLERDGYLPLQREVIVPPGGSVFANEVMKLTPAAEQRAELAARQRRRVALVFGAVGAAAMVGAGGVYSYSSAQHRDLEARRSRSSSASDLDRVASIQRLDDIAFGLAGLGVGLVAVGTGLYLGFD